MRVVLDANVLIAAAASRGLCEAVLELCLEKHRLVICDGILNEIERKLKTKLKVSPPVIAEYMGLLRENADTVAPEEVQASECRDPKDLMILGLVGPGKVDAVVTGDKDLLVLKKYEDARILTLREFWESSRRG